LPVARAHLTVEVVQLLRLVALWQGLALTRLNRGLVFLCVDHARFKVKTAIRPLTVKTFPV